MKKIIIKNDTAKCLMVIFCSGLNVGLLYAVTYYLYFYMSPFVAIQVLFAWLLMYNILLCFLATTPAIDHVYFVDTNERSFLSGTTEIFFSVATAIFVVLYFQLDKIMVHSYMANLYVLALTILYWGN